MKLKIPKGSKISNTGKKVIRIHVANTRYWVQGERKRKNVWDLFLVDPQTKYRELIQKNMTTNAFAILTNTTLKSPFPFLDEVK